MNKRVVASAAAVGMLAAVLIWQWSGLRRAPEWQGWIEADMLFLGPDEPGRVTELTVAEGDVVEAGRTLFRVEGDLQDAEWRQARAALEESQARLSRLLSAQQRPEEIAVLEAQRAQALAALEQSRPEFERAERLVAQGTSAQARLDQARSAYNRDQAQLSAINRQIEVARLQARPEDIRAAEEVVAQAKARVASAETRLRQRTVMAPVAGRVQEVLYRVGEVVPAGRSVVSLLPPDNLKVRFFIAQSDLSRITISTKLSVRCDGCLTPQTATVTFSSSTAEFTPPVIYSREERSKLVFRVEARPETPGAFRVGQPVSIAVSSTAVAAKPK